MPELRQLHLQMQRPNLTLNRRPDMQDMARFQHSMRYPSRTHSQAQAGVHEAAMRLVSTQYHYRLHHRTP